MWHGVDARELPDIATPRGMVTAIRSKESLYEYVAVLVAIK